MINFHMQQEINITEENKIKLEISGLTALSQFSSNNRREKNGSQEKANSKNGLHLRTCLFEILCEPFSSYTPIYSRFGMTRVLRVCLFVGDWILEKGQV